MKLLGAITLFFVCAALGFYIANWYARRAKELRQLRGALSVLETEISYGHTPLDQALTYVGSRETGPVGRFFTRCGELLRKKGGASAFDCWQKALAEAKSELALREEDRKILVRLGKKLGLSDREDQLHHLRLAQTTLETEEAHALKEKEKYEKLFRNLGVLTGALLVILMY